MGYSGGLDSSVLMHLLATAPTALKKHCQLLHINHQLSKNADYWQQHCATMAEQYDLPFKSVKVKVNNQGSLEAAARQARYQVFEQELALGDWLLLAHHGNDQLETQLQRLMRGSGSKGLVGIPALGHLAKASC